MAFKKTTIDTIAHNVILFAVGIFFFGYNSVFAATLQINSNSATLSPGGTAALSVVLNSEGVAINNAETKIVFPADLLEVVSISKAGSIFSLWVEEPAYSNSTGVITFNGGIPAPGFDGSYGTAISLVVKAKKSGQADILFSDASVRANDGLGTDVLRATTGKTLSIVQKEAPTIKETPVVKETLTPASSAVTLQVTSPTHASEELWYAHDSPTFKWKVPSGVTAVQTSIDDNTSGLPRVTYSPAISEKTVDDVNDGTWYFKVRAHKDGEWGPVSTYIAKVDTTIPKKNVVTFSYDSTKKTLHIDSDIVDETSGLSHYEIYFNGSFFKKVPAGDFVDGSYDIPVNTGGDNTVKLVAIDRAGNSVESSGTFKSTDVLEPEPEQPPPDTREQMVFTMGSFTIPAAYLIIILLVSAIILVLGAFTVGRHYSKLRSRLKVRSALANGGNTKVLLLFKKRLEKYLEMLQNTRHTRLLSKEEKAIKEAIESDLDELDRFIEKQRTQ